MSSLKQCLLMSLSISLSSELPPAPFPPPALLMPICPGDVNTGLTKVLLLLLLLFLDVAPVLVDEEDAAAAATAEEEVDAMLKSS